MHVVSAQEALFPSPSPFPSDPAGRGPQSPILKHGSFFSGDQELPRLLFPPLFCQDHLPAVEPFALGLQST